MLENTKTITKVTYERRILKMKIEIVKYYIYDMIEIYCSRVKMEVCIKWNSAVIYKIIKVWCVRVKLVLNLHLVYGKSLNTYRS